MFKECKPSITQSLTKVPSFFNTEKVLLCFLETGGRGTIFQPWTSPRSNRAKNSRAISQALQASLSVLNKWNNVTKVEMFGHNSQYHVWWKLNIAYQHKCQHTGEGQWFGLVSQSQGLGSLASLNSPVCQSILKLNVRPSVC